MSMTSLLTLVSMFNSLMTQVKPPISYATRLDVWMVACITTVFAILFEFTLVIIIKHPKPNTKRPKVWSKSNSDAARDSSSVWHDDHHSRGSLIVSVEKVSTVGIFAAFLVFNVAGHLLRHRK